MGRHFRDPLLLAWLGLCAATVLSLVIGGSDGVGGGSAVLGIAFAKAGVVMFVFMDLARAPLVLRLAATAWLACVLGALVAIYAGLLG
jgi:hypothetical protein